MGRPVGSARSPDLDTPDARCIHELFAERARLSSEAIALIDADKQYTYAELDAKTNQLARYLRQQGVGPETIVGCHLSRSTAIVICMLAILKAGGTYLLLDALLPSHRLQYLISNAEPLVVITDNAFPEHAEKSAVISLTQVEQQANHLAKTPITSAAMPSNAAYIAYTSGSTGRPKGVIITHQATVNHSRAFAELFGLTNQDRVPLMAPIAFDMATEEILPALMSGCTLIVSASRHTDMPAFTEEIRLEAYTILNIPAPLWHDWTEYLRDNQESIPPSLRLVIVGSDKIYTKRFKDWKTLQGADKVTWVAAYGTTETTVTSSFYTTARQDDLSNEPVIPIGKPIANTMLYILDEHGRPVEAGQVGELCIGGVGVARGYHKLEQTTQERFVPDPFSSQPHARMYKTGDLARAWADGTVVCLGRKDLQVKRNGLRIELGEIEAVLAEHPQVSQAAVILNQQGSREEDKQLIAFFTLSPEHAHRQILEDLKDFAGAHLHRHMIPDSFVQLARLPLNTNGKLDRRALEGYTIA